jgi:hypothetical protein
MGPISLLSWLWQSQAAPDTGSESFVLKPCIHFLFPHFHISTSISLPTALFLDLPITVAPLCPAEEFLFNERLLHLRSQGIEFHPHPPDDCPLDSGGLPTFSWSINHLPDQTDKSAILKFMGLSPSTIEEVLDLYAQDTEPHTNHDEAVYDGFMYTLPLVNRLWQLYAERNLSK